MKFHIKRFVDKWILENLPRTIFVCILIATAIIVYAGFSHKAYQVKICTVTTRAYVTAEFSETSIIVSTDDNGNMTTSTDIDYWSEPASEIYETTVTNGELIRAAYVGDGIEKNGYIIPPMPEHDKSFATMEDFDGFEKHRDETLYIIVSTPQDSDRFSEPAYKYQKCLDKIDSTILVNTWYGKAYSSDF